jgi:hypothetical protein
MIQRILLVLLLTLALSSLASAQKFVTEKPYTDWGREDALRLITDSPWAKPYQSTSGSSAAAAQQSVREQNQSASRGGSNPRSVSRDFGPPPVTARLHSGVPIRQAIVRLQQFEVGYDRMSDADKALFDKGRKGFLECPICKDYYVITLVKAVDASGQLADEALFQGMSAADLKGNVKLVNDDGEERELVEFNAPKNSRDAAVLYFKRTDASGKPLLTKDSKDFKIIFSSEFLSTKNRFAYLIPRTFEFKVSKLVAANDVLF